MLFPFYRGENRPRKQKWLGGASTSNSKSCSLLMTVIWAFHLLETFFSVCIMEAMLCGSVVGRTAFTPAPSNSQFSAALIPLPGRLVFLILSRSPLSIPREQTRVCVDLPHCSLCKCRWETTLPGHLPVWYMIVFNKCPLNEVMTSFKRPHKGFQGWSHELNYFGQHEQRPLCLKVALGPR